MSGHQSGSVVLTEAERHELAYVGCSHHKADSALRAGRPKAIEAERILWSGPSSGAARSALTNAARIARSKP